MHVIEAQRHSAPRVIHIKVHRLGGVEVYPFIELVAPHLHHFVVLDIHMTGMESDNREHMSQVGGVLDAHPAIP